MRRFSVFSGLTAFLLVVSAPSTKTQSPALYDANPDHLWNRLFNQFYLRTSFDGRQYGGDILDPPLWSETKYLLSGPSNQQAVTRLNQFLSSSGEKLVNDPVKRAMLQRDLWAVFDWLKNIDANEYPGRGLLRERLAEILVRLALSPEQIRSLPDNYAIAAASKAFPAQYDPAHRDFAFLPPDLLDASGSWVCLGNKAGSPLAVSHVESFGGRSAFFIFLRLPGGRRATQAYLTQLRDFPNPTVPNHDQSHESVRHAGGGFPFIPNPNLPQFPAGTEVALVRQMLLIDTDGRLSPTPLTESVQIRVFREVPSREVWKAGSFGQFQDVFEFRLSRALLFAGKQGGLRAVGSEETEYPQGLFTQGFDELEQKEEGSHANQQAPVLPQCGVCHDAPGIHAVLSYSRGPWPLTPENKLPGLTESTPAEQRQTAIHRKQDQEDWGLIYKFPPDGH